MIVAKILLVSNAVAGSAQLRSSIRTQLTSYGTQTQHGTDRLHSSALSPRRRRRTLCVSRLATGDKRKRCRADYYFRGPTELPPSLAALKCVF